MENPLAYHMAEQNRPRRRRRQVFTRFEWFAVFFFAGAFLGVWDWLLRLLGHWLLGLPLDP